jgi:hypothetical protein
VVEVGHLAEGAHAVVKLGEFKSMPVAIKIYNKSKIEDQKAFVNEVEME